MSGKDKFFSFRNSKVRYRDQGKGRAIVLVHGFLESLEIWNSFSAKLSKSYRVITLDLPGHGQSDPIGYVHSMELMAQCIKSLMDHLKLRRYIVIGHSMGGYAALGFADLFPDNLRGLGLFHSIASADSPEKKKDRDRAINAVKKNHKQFVKELIVNLFAPDNRKHLKEKIKEVQEIALKTPKQGIIAGLEGMKVRKDREIILQFAHYPVLFIIGNQDKAIPLEPAKKQTALPEKRMVLILDNAAHMGFFEEPDQTLKTVKSFVAKVYSNRI